MHLLHVLVAGSSVRDRQAMGSVLTRGPQDREHESERFYSVGRYEFK
jgi:hypothetical protein